MSTPYSPGPGMQPYAPPPKKPRPSAWWFLGPGLLLVACVGVAVVAIATAVTSFSAPTYEVSADGTTTSLEVTAGTDHLIWTRQGSMVPNCVVVDAATSQPLSLSSPNGQYTWNSWTGSARFRPTSDTAEITCTGMSSPDPMSGPGMVSSVRVGEAPDIGGFVGGIFLGIVVPILLGGIALIWGVVLLILMLSRGPRRPAHPVQA